MLDLARFTAFFSALNGVEPYPWQRALAQRVAETGRWPDIAAPTGAGKSSVIDIHVFLVAEHAAGRLATRPPRRLVLVAPRRVLVDDQHDRALAISARLREAADGPLADVATALAALRTASDERGPLPVWKLRGGILLDHGWRLDPSACQVICATPQMWGSRILLRGYAATRRSRNLEAGLLGHDAVAIVDEAHLHRRLVETARRLAEPSETSLQVVAMSATQPPTEGQAGIGPDDLADPALARRVTAGKRVRRVDGVKAKDLAKAVVEQAEALAGDGTVGVFVNDVPTALEVASQLPGTVELVCGRLRPADVARLRERRPTLLTPEGDDDVDFLVSTQSLEVGVDLDLAAMVSVLAPAPALAQRAGRLNRSGSRSESTFAVVVPDDLRAAAGPYPVAELERALDWLERLGGSISPQAVLASEPPLPERPPLPALRPLDLATLAMTSDAQGADPDPALYLEDPQPERRAEVGVIARRHLDLDDAAVAAALRACPPRAHEIAPLAVGDTRRRVKVGDTLRRVIAAAGEHARLVRVVDGEIVVLRVAQEGPVDNDADAATPTDGDVLVVPHGAPICTEGVVGLGERRGEAEPLGDVLEQAPPGEARDRIVPLAADAVAPLVEADPVLGGRAARTALAALLAEEHPELADRLRHARLSDLAVTWCAPSDETVGLLVVRDMQTRATQVPLAVLTEPVTVDAHQAAVAERLNQIVDRLRSRTASALRERLVQAANAHDDGKRHPRFQRLMGASEVALAKPLPGHVPDRGDGWRHEQLSAAYAAAASGGDPLVVALVGAHHGAGRPLFDRGAAELLDGWDGCPEEVAEWVARLYGPCGRYELLRDRAQREFGVHGLAWLEALLRCADMQISKEGR